MPFSPNHVLIIIALVLRVPNRIQEFLIFSKIKEIIPIKNYNSEIPSYKVQVNHPEQGIRNCKSKIEGKKTRKINAKIAPETWLRDGREKKK